MSLRIMRVLYGPCRSLALGLNLSLHHLKLLSKHSAQKLHRRKFFQLGSLYLNPPKQLLHVLTTPAVTILPLGFA